MFPYCVQASQSTGSDRFEIKNRIGPLAGGVQLQTEEARQGKAGGHQVLENRNSVGKDREVSCPIGGGIKRTILIEPVALLNDFDEAY